METVFVSLERKEAQELLEERARVRREGWDTKPLTKLLWAKVWALQELPTHDEDDNVIDYEFQPDDIVA